MRTSIASDDEIRRRDFDPRWGVLWDRLPYGNRVRVEPGAFGRRRAVLDAVAGVLAEQVSDEWGVVPGPVSSGLVQAREQFRRAQLLDVPDGFVRISTRFEGFEDEGALGVIYLLLKERRAQDRPW